jgi:hypothetical protein
MRPTWLLVVALVTGFSDGVAPRGLEPAPSPSPTGGTAGDVDGDGRPDTATVVESGPRGDPDWRFGVRVAMTTAGPRTAWATPGAGGNDGQSVEGYADVNADGRAEVVVQVGTTASAGLSQLVTLAGDRLVLVETYDLWAGLVEGGEGGWGCADGQLYTVVAGETGGTVTWFRLDGDRLVETGREEKEWAAGATRPSPFHTAGGTMAGCA